VGLAVVALLGGTMTGVAVLFAPEAGAASDSQWYVSFRDVFVPPVERENVSQLVDVGTIETDGFSDLVFSMGGEFKEKVPSSGTVGAILIPDIDMFDHLLRTEAEFAFPLEVKAQIGNLNSAIFISEQQTARIAFPAYRVYMYNETGSAARVSLHVYRTRF
jgi:hypothetical protein